MKLTQQSNLAHGCYIVNHEATLAWPTRTIIDIETLGETRGRLSPCIASTTNPPATWASLCLSVPVSCGLPAASLVQPETGPFRGQAASRPDDFSCGTCAVPINPASGALWFVKGTLRAGFLPGGNVPWNGRRPAQGAGPLQPLSGKGEQP